ncbi:MAG: cytochrome c-type biogenesis protein CcmH [Gammaproteobacteria bacterium]|nr:cytochrome c-type biogenesis protein CcmH [Gammaproteobacteria bacterium]
MNPIKQISFTLILVLTSLSISAAINVYQFDDPVKKERFYNLIDELRCTVCQNQTIAASNAGLAKDLRNKTYKMIQAGKTDDEIKTFMVERFTDFVLYNPPVNNSTLLLWIGPAVLMLIAFIFLISNIRKRVSTPVTEIDAQEHERVQTLLKQKKDGNND